MTALDLGVTRDGSGCPITRDFVRAVMGDTYDWPETTGRLRLSGMGACRRRSAYTASGTAPSDLTTTHPAAQLGTWIHEGLLPALAKVVPDAEIEKEVWWTPEPGAEPILGHLDLTTPGVVTDLKTMSEWPMDRFVSDGPRLGHRWQVHTYAEAECQAGRPVERVQIIAVDRSSGDVETWEEPHTADHVAPVVEWVREVRRYAESNPDAAPRDERGPGRSYLCDHCAWLRRCWGPVAEPGVTGPQADPENTEAVASALALYRAALDAEARAKGDKAFAAAVIAGAEPGVYGDHELRWRRPHNRRPSLDHDETERLLRLFGLTPVYQPGSHVGTSPIVRPARGRGGSVPPPDTPPDPPQEDDDV